MSANEEILQTNEERDQRSSVCKLVLNYLIKIMASLILPLTLGMFTIFITLHQQDLAMKQRVEDRQLVREQRMEDQRELQLQRKQEWEIATRQYEADKRALRERYQDEILTAYFKEMGDLIEKSNGSVVFTNITAVLARVKTLNALRQLDGSRSKHLVRFLYEAKQLSNEEGYSSIELDGSDLIDIDFTHSKLEISFKHLSLQGTFMENCSFHKISLHDADFYKTVMENVNFSFAKFRSAIFVETQMTKSSFRSADLVYVDFSKAELIDIDLTDTKARDIDFSFATLTEIFFSFTETTRAEFSEADLNSVDFTETTFDGVDFVGTFMYDTSFERTEIAHGDFTEADLIGVRFTSADLKDVDFPSTDISQTDFSFASIRNADFSGNSHFRYFVYFENRRLKFEHEIKELRFIFDWFIH